MSNSKISQKIFKEIDKRVNELDTHVGELFTLTNNNQMNKKLALINKELEGLYKYIFDIKNFDMDIFEFFIEKKIVNLLTSYLGLQNVELTKLLLPVIEKILFHSRTFYEKIELSEEICLMNISVVNSLKILIHVLVSTVKIIDDKYDENLIGVFVNFLYTFLEKLIIYPNFYNAISSSNSPNEENFDSALFELIIELFSKDHLMTKREHKARTRKTLLLCLNLEHFYTINISFIEKLLENLVDNLVMYYEDFKKFDAAKYLLDKKEIANTLKKEKIPIEELVTLNKDDLISYLKYFSIVFHCFSQPQMKKFLSNLLFNKLFLEYIQKDLLNVYVMNSVEKKINKVFEFLLHLTEHVKNKETSEILFYFFFGFNNYSPAQDEVEDFLNENNEENDEVNQYSNNDEFSIEEDNMMTIQDIRINIENLIKNNLITGKNISNLNMNIDKNSHKFESILSFFINIIESSSDYMLEIKINLMKLLTNIVKNSSNLFLIEILIPFYLNCINSQTKTFDKIYERIRSSRDRIDLIEIMKNVHPKYFTLDLTNWSEYFESSLEQNYERNIFMLENIDINDKPDGSNNNSGLFLSNLSNYGNLFLENNFFNQTNIQDSFATNRKVINTTFATYSTSPNFLDIDDNANTPNTTGNNREFISPFKNDSSLNSNSNNIINKDNCSNCSSIINIRVHFYEILTKYLRKFSSNKYVENLFLTELFLEIYSLPYLIHMGEQGEALYNIYSNVTFAGKKKLVLYKTSSVGIISEIGAKLDEMIRFNFRKEEIERELARRIKEKLKSDGVNNRIPAKNENFQNVEFLDNLILFSEFFKEYISNIFAKCYFDQINANYTKALSDTELLK